jgi:hypothetical protein
MRHDVRFGPVHFKNVNQINAISDPRIFLM